MLPVELSKKVLTIGCEYNPPMGGVAQVMYTYAHEVYPIFHCVTNSGPGGPFKKLCSFACGFISTAYVLLLNKNIKIVHIHTASYNSFKRSAVFISLARLFRKIVVLHIHGGGFKEYFKTKPRWIKKKLSDADCVIALTDNWKRFFQDEIHLSKVVTINNVVPYPAIRDTESDGRVHLLFLGCISEQKGVFDLVEVIRKHSEEWIGKLLLHIGGNNEVEKLVQYIRDYKLQELICYEGWVSGERKTLLMNQMNAFILPSYVEGLPISVLEALSYGKPVITTRVGGIPEIVNDASGYLFEPGDKSAMYSIINRIINNPAELLHKGTYAKASVESHFPNRVSEVLDVLYTELLTQ